MAAALFASTIHGQSSAERALALTALAAGFLAYVLPWALAPSAALTLQAYDLAEWASLHPAQAAALPALPVSLLLRAQLVLLSALMGLLAADAKRRWALLIALLAIAQLPPLEWLLDPGNLNYRQQMAMAASSLILGFAALRLPVSRLSAALIAALSLAGIAAAIIGAQQALSLFAQLNMTASAGAGPPLLCGSYLGLALLSTRWLMPRQNADS